MSNPHGLATQVADAEPVFLPLKSVSVFANIVDVSARVELVQVYENASKLKNATAQYIFPIPANAAVCAFKMKTAEGRVVEAVVKKLETSRREYEDAVANDQWAGLLQQVTGDVFLLSVGAIPARQDITVSITYVQDLAQDELVNQIRFSLPTYIAERYGEPPAAIAEPSSSSKLAKLNVIVKVQMASYIEKIFSPSHQGDVDCTKVVKVSANGSSVHTSTVTFKPGAAQRRLDKDFVLSIQAMDLHKPRCVAEVDVKKKSIALSLTLVPKFGVDEITAQEYIFIIDRSGSMGTQDRIEQAKDALQVLLKSLPSDDTFFNIVGFGSSFVKLWKTSQSYDHWSLNTATAYVDGITADMGGTEIWGALQDVFRNRITSIPTSVFILTDGEVWNFDGILSSVRSAVATAGPASEGRHLRVFTLGVGDGASTALCEGIARAGKGICYMTTRSEGIAKRCANLLQAAKSPPIASLYNISVDWGYAGSDEAAYPSQKEKGKARGSEYELPDAKPIQQAPSSIPEIFLQNRYIISAILSGTTTVPREVLIKGRVPGGSEFSIPIPVHEAKSTPLLHTLAARRLITELQDGDISSVGLGDGGERVLREEIVKAAVERYSVDYQLVSKYAAFVVVEDERENAEDVNTTVSNHGDDDVDLPIDTNVLVEEPAAKVEVIDREYDLIQSGIGTDGGDCNVGRKRVNHDQENATRVKGGGDPSTQTVCGSKRNSKTRWFAAATSLYNAARTAIAGATKGFWSRFHLPAIAQVVAHAAMANPAALATSRVLPALAPYCGSDICKDFYYEAPPPMVRTVTRRTEPAPPRITIVSPNNGATPIARLQSFDGSFALDEGLVKLLENDSSEHNGVTLHALKNAIPDSIKLSGQAEKVWATVLMVAYLKTTMPDDKEIWRGLWQKAMHYVMQTIGGDAASFSQLVNEAEGQFFAPRV